MFYYIQELLLLPKNFFPFGISFEGFLCLLYSIVGSFCTYQSQEASFALADVLQRQFKQIRHVTISVQRDLPIFSFSLRFVLNLKEIQQRTSDLLVCLNCRYLNDSDGELFFHRTHLCLLFSSNFPFVDLLFLLDILCLHQRFSFGKF